MEDPLHPFELHAFIPLSLPLLGLDISINKAVVMMLFVVLAVIVFLTKARSSGSLVPTKIQSIAEMMVEFIRGMIHDTMGPEGMRFFPLVSTLFLFILFSNLLGLIPGSYTITSQLVVTGVFAVFVYSLSIVLGLKIHGPKFIKAMLIPSGTPPFINSTLCPLSVAFHNTVSPTFILTIFLE